MPNAALTKIGSPVVLAAAALILAGCGSGESRSTASPSDQPQSPSVTTSAASPSAPQASADSVPSHDSMAATPTDKWLGKWTGPEGTALTLVGGNGKYEVTIRNLDGPRTFPGVANGNHIDFTRDGTKESIHATNGKDTGMKWLADKTDCLTVHTGEGYCRS